MSLAMERPARTLLWLVVLASLCLSLTSTPALAHMAGALDHYGCHADRRKGGYHCHSGRMNGEQFASKSAMLKALKSGAAVQDDPAPEEKRSSGWKIPSLFKRSTGSAPSGQSSGAALVPSGIEKRLRILKRLHDEGLINDQEYDDKRRDILGDL